MAGDWIKLRADLPTDPAVGSLARKTRLDRWSVVGRLAAFWAWADKHAVDGHVDGAASTDVDEVVGKKGFANALIEVGWLIVDARGISLPKHERHNGESGKERSLKNARQARWRDGKKSLSETSTKTPYVDASPSTKASTKASTREEKRREEEKEIPKPSVSPPPTSSSGLSPFPPGFEAFWSVYPRKVGKDAAIKAYARRKFTQSQRQAVLDSVAAQLRWEAWTKDGGQFIPHPATWLNEGRWQDEEPSGFASADRFAGSEI